MIAERADRTFLVTGATGFIGSHLMEALVAAHGAGAVTALVPPARTGREGPIFHRLNQLGVPMIMGDLRALPKVPKIPAFDVVYHLAACAEPENPRADFSVNDEGTRHLLDWLGPASPGRRFVFTSTLACVDRSRPRGPINESTPCTPRTVYGRTKLRAEEFVRASRSRLGSDFTILRLCTIIGPGFRPTGMFGLCSTMLARGALATRLNWPGRSSYLGIGDLIRILLDLPALPQSANETFVLSNGEDPTFDDLLGQLARVLRHERRRIEWPRWLWRIIVSATWPLAAVPLTPPGLRTACWRASHIINDGIYADSSKLNILLGSRYQSVTDALREAYATVCPNPP